MASWFGYRGNDDKSDVPHLNSRGAPSVKASYGALGASCREKCASCASVGATYLLRDDIAGDARALYIDPRDDGALEVATFVTVGLKSMIELEPIGVREA